MKAPKLDDYRIETTKGNALEAGGLKEWNWTRNDGEYWKSRDFLTIHWEIHLPKFPEAVRLHVEAPRFADDEELNNLKREIVEAILASDLDEVAARAGFTFKRGTRLTESNLKCNKCTEPFRVVLSKTQMKTTHRANIEQVHEALWQDLAQTLTVFIPRLERAFGKT